MTKMAESAFWELVDRAKRRRDGTLDIKSLQNALVKLPPADIEGFHQRFLTYFAKSYTSRLWGAAALIHVGAPGDTFDSFRSWLIGQGRDVFMAAMKDPDTLADIATPEALDDELAGVADAAYKSVTGKHIPSSSFKLPKLDKKLDFNDSRAMARAYPKLFDKFGTVESVDPSEALLERCRKYAGAKGRWTSDDVEGFFDRFRPDGKGLAELFSGIEFGEEISKRLISVMKVDGTTDGSTLSANQLVAVSADRAVALVKSWFEKIRSLAQELDDSELAERFTVSQFETKAAKRKFSQNEFTAEAIQMLCDTAFSIVYESVSPLVVLAPAVYSLVGVTPLAFYIQWPLVAERFQTIDPFKPFFDLWCRGIEWQLTSDGIVEVYVN